MISENAKYWIWLTQCLGYNNPKLNKLHELYDNIVKFVEGGEYEWRLSGVLHARKAQEYLFSARGTLYVGQHRYF